MKVRIVHPAGAIGASGPRVGILENRKANARLLLIEIGRRLAERIGAAPPLVFDKANASAACPPERLREIAGEVDLVLVGSAD